VATVQARSYFLIRVGTEKQNSQLHKYMIKFILSIYILFSDRQLTKSDEKSVV
jgi:hypothetical protein